MKVTRDSAAFEPEISEGFDALAEETASADEMVEVVEATIEPLHDASLVLSPNQWRNTRTYADEHAAEMEQLRERLNQPLDPALVKQREGYGREKDGSQKMLKYLEWHTAVRQLNRLIGVNKWTTEIKEVKTFGEDPTTGVPRAVSVTMSLSVEFPNGDSSYFSNVGMEVVKPRPIYENNRKVGETFTWDAFEMAYKGAAHDALKRCATALGEQFGLSLYVKEEEAKIARVTGAVEGDASANSATYPAKALPASRSKPATSSTTSKFQNVAPEDYDADADETVACEECGDGIHGYFSERLNRVYTTADLVAISKRKTGGRTLCYNCQNPRQNAR